LDWRLAIKLRPKLIDSSPLPAAEKPSKQPSPESEAKFGAGASAFPVTPRPRRITEARDSIESLENRDPTVFEIRKADHRKKFTTGIPERTQITMFDLVGLFFVFGSRVARFLLVQHTKRGGGIY
jgi:hypothetical protein